MGINHHLVLANFHFMISEFKFIILNNVWLVTFFLRVFGIQETTVACPLKLYRILVCYLMFYLQ